MKRILVYSHDTFGLGNIRRMLEIARHLVASSSQVSVLVITGSPMLHAFRIPERVDYVKLPCLARDVEGRYAPRLTDMSMEETVRLRANLIRNAIAGFDPHLILVDKKPFGVENELSGALADLPQRARRPKLVLLLRDILDSPEATVPVWRRQGYFEAIDTYYDEVLVVGSPYVFDLRREYAFPPFAAAKVRFCGYIARQPGRQSRAAMRERLGVAADEPLLLVTPGGGQDGFQLIDASVRALTALPAHACPRTHIVCGPELDALARERIAHAIDRQPRLSLQEFSDDMMSLMAAADVVVSMGGYNTVCELMTLKKRVVVVPRVRPVKEQLIRAERLAARGLLRMLHPDQLAPDMLWSTLRAELAAWQGGTPQPHLSAMNGLEQTTAALLEQLGLGAPAALPAMPPRLRQRGLQAFA
jgi:predicted glycosyltransferase